MRKVLFVKANNRPVEQTASVKLYEACYYSEGEAASLEMAVNFKTLFNWLLKWLKPFKYVDCSGYCSRNGCLS